MYYEELRLVPLEPVDAVYKYKEQLAPVVIQFVLY